MSFSKVHFSSKDNERETPHELFDLLTEEFRFKLDVCATQWNAKCSKFYTKRQNGLLKAWHLEARGACWMNPPYGKYIVPWVEKATYEAHLGATVVALLPSRTDTEWWHRYVVQAREIRFLKGRLKFVGAKSSAPFPSVVVIFDGYTRALKVRHWDWKSELRN